MIKIFGKPNCDFCTRAVQLCESQAMEFEYKSIGKDIELDEVLEMTAPERPRTAPVVFIDGVFIGGYTEMAAAIG